MYVSPLRQEPPVPWRWHTHRPVIYTKGNKIVPHHKCHTVCQKRPRSENAVVIAIMHWCFHVIVALHSLVVKLHVRWLPLLTLTIVRSCVTLCTSVCEARVKQRISSPTKGAVSACLVLNLWPRMNRNLLSKLNCLCVIVATLVSGGVMSIFVFPLASVLVSIWCHICSTTQVNASGCEVSMKWEWDNTWGSLVWNCSWVLCFG